MTFWDILHAEESNWSINGSFESKKSQKGQDRQDPHDFRAAAADRGEGGTAAGSRVFLLELGQSLLFFLDQFFDSLVFEQLFELVLPLLSVFDADSGVLKDILVFLIVISGDIVINLYNKLTFPSTRLRVLSSTTTIDVNRVTNCCSMARSVISFFICSRSAAWSVTFSVSRFLLNS